MSFFTTRYFAQFGEDRILRRIFSDRPFGFCVEVGANDGVNGSNTLHFERLGWTCVLVEPNPELRERIARTRTGRVFSCAASSEAGSLVLNIAVGEGEAHGVSSVGGNGEAHVRSFGFEVREVIVDARTLDSIIAETNVGMPLDFLTVDVEGHELSVLQGFSLEKWKPRIVIVEDNSRFSDRKVREHMARYGYVPFKRTGVNDWYVHLDDPLYTRAARTSYRLRMQYEVLRKTAEAMPVCRDVKRFQEAFRKTARRSELLVSVNRTLRHAWKNR